MLRYPESNITIVFKKYSEDGIQVVTVGTSGGILST